MTPEDNKIVKSKLLAIFQTFGQQELGNRLSIYALEGFLMSLNKMLDDLIDKKVEGLKCHTDLIIDKEEQ